MKLATFSQETTRAALSGGEWGARTASGNFLVLDFIWILQEETYMEETNMNPTAGLILVTATYKKSASCPHLDW